jgi:hypothetical protein
MAGFALNQAIYPSPGATPESRVRVGQFADQVAIASLYFGGRRLASHVRLPECADPLRHTIPRRV